MSTMKPTTSDAPTFRPGDKKCNVLFAQSQKARLKPREYREGPIECLRGVMSNDINFLRFKDWLSKELTRQCPANVEPDGRVTGNGVRAPFYGLRYVGGYPSMGTYPLADNRYLREQEGLVNGWTKPWHETCARALTRLFFSGIKPVAMKLRVNSSSMMPHYSKDMNEKMELSRHALAHGRTAAEHMMKGDYITPWLEWYIGGAYHTVYRRQPTDSITIVDGVMKPKDRRWADLEFAISGGRRGKFEPADRNLGDVGFQHPKGFFRERNRTAMGGPLGLNANLMIIAQAVRRHIYDKFAYTYHHTTRISQQADLRQLAFLTAADVSNHDWFWPTFMVDTFAQELLELGYAPWWVHLYKVRFNLPNYVTDVGPGEGQVLIGDPFAPNLTGGLPSGNAFTDIDGTMCMTLVYFFTQVEHTYPELIPQLATVEGAERVLEKYLTGKLGIVLKDKSDDAILGWTDHFFEAKARKLLTQMQEGKQVSEYMKVSYENGYGFLGSILLTPKNGSLSELQLIGNVNSLVSNMFSPEYGVQSEQRDRTKAQRPYPGLAFKTLSQNYGTAPMYHQVMEIVEYGWGRFYGTSYQKYREDWLKDDERALMDRLSRERHGIPDLSPIDLEVLQDPSKLQYKYDVTDVSPVVANMMFNGLTEAEITPYFKEIYNG